MFLISKMSSIRSHYNRKHGKSLETYHGRRRSVRQESLEFHEYERLTLSQSQLQRHAYGHDGDRFASSMCMPPMTAQGTPMERTPSGNEIIFECEIETKNRAARFSCTDHVQSVQDAIHSFRKYQNSTLSLELRATIQAFLDRRDGNFDGICNKANVLFFGGLLTNRVQWEWSTAERYCEWLMGTTAFRDKGDGGLDCLVILSEHLLRRRDSDQILAVKVFLHELVHCYLFICCGESAKTNGGHTRGFFLLEETILDWLNGRFPRAYESRFSRCGTEEGSGRWHLYDDMAYPVFDDVTLSRWRNEEQQLRQDSRRIRLLSKRLPRCTFEQQAQDAHEIRQSPHSFDSNLEGCSSYDSRQSSFDALRY